jgi:hypothetical protein
MPPKRSGRKAAAPESNPELDAQIRLREEDGKIFNPNTQRWILSQSSVALQLFARMQAFKEAQDTKKKPRSK